MVQSLGIQKLVSKIIGIWATSDKQWKVQKNEIWWAFVQKSTFLQLRHYIQWIYLANITFSYLCVDSPNYLCHFWNHKLFFTTQLLCIFLAQTLHTFYKSNSSKCEFSDFRLLKLKFTKFLKFGSFFTVMRDHSPVLFKLKLYVLLEKVVYQSANFQTCHCSH